MNRKSTKNTNEKYLECLSNMYKDSKKNGDFENMSFYTNYFGINTSLGRALQDLQLIQKTQTGKNSKYVWKGPEPDSSMASEVRVKTSAIALFSKNQIPYQLNDSKGINIPSTLKNKKLSSVKEIKEKVYNEVFDKACTTAIASTSKAIMLMELAGVDFKSLPEENKMKLVKELSK